ncbi:MAG TPA: hypothetical protein VK760_07535, partial [Candidatus Acidoferrales bacterium]|nr:hypothetical protein [Candidatus Acidoferrales bacterium]
RPPGGSNWVLPPDHKKRKLVAVHFFIKLPKTKHHKHPKRGAHYIGAGAKSVTIALNSINGGATPPPGLLTSVTTNISNCTSGCEVYGPSVPPGTDNMTITVYDANGGVGNALSTATQDFSVAVATANSLSVSLNGIVSTFSMTLPSGHAGTAISSEEISVEADDADGNAISGPYSQPFTIQEIDDTSATTLSVNAGTAGTSVQTAQSSDVIDFAYSGKAIDTAGFNSPTVDGFESFQPSVANPTSVCNGAGGGDETECADGPQINLYAPSGTGSIATFTTSQTGWSESPFLQTFTESDDCSSIADITTSDNLTFKATVVASPFAGTCTATVTGGGATANKSEAITITYTTSGVGINARHANPKHKP